MSLQVRLSHTLGDRWMELPPRGVDEPLVVGRAGTADVQVPSVTVAQKHCVLFVHDGRWVVQDIAGSTGTYVNATKSAGPTFLNVGDRVTLGPDPGGPSIEIDPAGVAEGRTGQPATAASAGVSPSVPVEPPQIPAPAPAVPAPTGGSYPVYPAYSTPYPGPQPPAAPIPAMTPQYGAPADQLVAGWPLEATPQYYIPRRRKRSFDSSNGVVLGMVATLIIAAAIGYWLYRRQLGSEQVVQLNPSATAPVVTSPPAPKPPPDDHPAKTRPSIFDPGGLAPTATTRPVTRPPATAPTTGIAAVPSPSPLPPPDAMPAPTPPDAGGLSSAPDAAVPPGSAAGQDPSETSARATDDPAWKQVLLARGLKDEGKAIILFDDFARTHPDTSTDKLQEYTEAMLDRIWFERIEGLCNQREELGRKIAELDQEIAEEADPKYKKTVALPLRGKYADQLKSIEEELVGNMKYTGKSGPNLLDDAELAKLRQARDPQYYSNWKTRILAHIRRTHGELPWVTNKSL